MRESQLLLETVHLQLDNGQIYWPKEVSSNAYVLVYNHSDLIFEQSPKHLDATKLYEAWAFDGVNSWHIWRNDTDWVCTSYDTSKVPEENSMTVKQYLANKFQKKINKKCLVIHQTIAFDEHEQAYIAYSCPIDVTKEG